MEANAGAIRFYHNAVLPWTASADEERRFRRIMAAAVVISLLLGLLMPVIKAPEVATQAEEIPPRFAKLIVEPRPPPPPPQPVQREEPAVPEPEKKVEEAPKPKPETPIPERRPQPTARERAAKQGLLALSDKLSELRDTSVTQELEHQTLHPSSTAGTRPADTPIQRSIITSQVNSGSGGINVSQLSRDTGGTQLAGRETTRVDAPVDETPAGVGPARAGRNTIGPRSIEEIQRVFDANRGTLNTLYNRALRENPSLAGKVVLKLTILPNGDISELEIVSSELKDADLERRLIARVRLFKFVAKNVAVTTITYPIDFFPG
jgi:TonB family protein